MKKIVFGSNLFLALKTIKKSMPDIGSQSITTLTLSRSMQVFCYTKSIGQNLYNAININIWCKIAYWRNF